MATTPESKTLEVELGVVVEVCHPSTWELRLDDSDGHEAILGDTGLFFFPKKPTGNHPQGSWNAGLQLPTLVSIFLATMLLYYFSMSTHPSP